MKKKTEADPSSDPAKLKQAVINKGSWIRLQPSLGMGLIPSVKTDVVTKNAKRANHL